MLRKRFRTKRIYSIPNGFDPQDDADGIKPDPGMFLITHTGHVRTDCQDPEILFRATSELVKTKKIDRRLIKVRYYGEITNKLLRDIDKYAIKDVVQADGIRRPRNDILPKQMESSLLIISAALDPANTGTVPGKIYEYLAAKRPVLAIGKPDGADFVEDILDSTCAGVYARTLEEIKQTIMLYYNQFIEKGAVEYSGISSEIDKFSYKEMALKYAEALHKIVRV
jgi:glycosyltransferase involved in cell wall biosynthesis